MSQSLSSNAVVFEKPGQLKLRSLVIKTPEANEITVDVEATGISTGTEKMLWDGSMPAFPGLSYPLVPGYEAVGLVASIGEKCNTTLQVGDRVFIPGANCYSDGVRGLFGASASRLVVPATRVTHTNELPADQATLLALAATAMHILTRDVRCNTGEDHLKLTQIIPGAPQLIVGHGVLGRLLARIVVALGAQTPLVWETNPLRQGGAADYHVISPDDDDGLPRSHIVDVSGCCGDHFNQLIARMSKGGRLTLGGFYSEAVNFNFAPAFMREISISIAAEWVPDDLRLVLSLVNAGALSLDGLVTDQYPHTRASEAYTKAFNDPECLKMILKWSA